MPAATHRHSLRSHRVFARSRSKKSQCLLFFLITHLFVVLYEEPTLRRTFGDERSERDERHRR